MYTRIWSTLLDAYTCTKSTETEERSQIKIRRLNLFIGQNNSGKSRFIRTLFMSKPDQYQFVDSEFNENEGVKVRAFEAIYKGMSHGNNQSLPYSEITKFFSDKAYSVNETTKAVEIHNQFIDRVINFISNSYDDSDASTAISSIEGLRKDPNKFKVLHPITYKISNQKKIYIPILRGMRFIGDRNMNDTDFFYNRTLKDYFKEGVPRLDSIITGIHLYNLLRDKLLGEPEHREEIANYQELLSKEFFSSKKVTLIPKHGEDVVFVKIGDDDQFPIYELGDGIQQVIIITSVTFFNSEPALFFIEEPEHSLHPGLLRQLVSFLLKHTKHQYFITTHSNHLLDLYEYREDITIHKLNRLAETKRFEITEYQDNDRGIFAELGVRPSSVYLSNCTIWVEGITDRLYIRVFMKRYMKDQETNDNDKYKKLSRLIENYHYAFVEYQGGNLVHWNFDKDDVSGGEDAGLCALRTSAKAFLVCDGDIVGKGNRQKIFQEQLGERLFVWECKEIENALPHNIICQTAKDLFDGMKRDKSGFDISRLNDIKNDYFNHSSKGIGSLLDEALNGNSLAEGEGEKIFADKSGTIYNKVKFCNLAIEKMEASMESWQMTDDLNNLCKKIFDHILNENQVF